MPQMPLAPLVEASSLDDATSVLLENATLTVVDPARALVLAAHTFDHRARTVEEVLRGLAASRPDLGQASRLNRDATVPAPS